MLRRSRPSFWSEAAKPAKLYIKDSAFDPYTSTAADIKPLVAQIDYRNALAKDGKKKF